MNLLIQKNGQGQLICQSLCFFNHLHLCVQKYQECRRMEVMWNYLKEFQTLFLTNVIEWLLNFIQKYIHKYSWHACHRYLQRELSVNCDKLNEPKILINPLFLSQLIFILISVYKRVTIFSYQISKNKTTKTFNVLS